MKLFTMQNISVLDLLKQGKIYRADYNRIFDKDYLKLYKFLAHQARFEDCPIFCATEKSKNIISSSGLYKSKSNVMLTLNVPDDETYCTEYYTWTDYLYFSTEDTNYDYVKELENELKQNLIPEHCHDPQVIIDRIEPTWVEGLIINDHKNDDLEDISLNESDLIDDLYKDLMIWLRSKVAVVDKPSNGPMYILPDGKFLDVLKIPACYIHQHLFAEFLFSNKIKFDSYNLMRSIEGRFNWLRVNDGKSDDEFRCYISLDHDKLNSDQYYALLLWLDFVSRSSDYVQVFVDNDPKSYVKYYFKNYTSDEIIKKIKRYYTSNTLYESDLVEVKPFVKFDKTINELSEDILRFSDDISDRYLRKYFSNYHKELVSLDDILKDTDNLHDNAMKMRRTEVWGQDPDLYKYDITKGYYGSLQEPIRVAKINGKFIVLDGNHRLRALANSGHKQVEVLVRNV